MNKFSRALKSIIPAQFHLPLLFAYFKMQGKLDNEIFIEDTLYNTNERAIDVGANIGIYSYMLSKTFKNVEAFEPIKKCTKMLEKYAKRKNINIYYVGLSNETREQKLYIPLIDSRIENIALASVHDSGGERAILNVQMCRLDDYNFENVGLIKIDTEGNEVEVIKGAIKTIEKYKPTLLIEIEQRHLQGRTTIDDVFDFIQSLGYTGYYYDKKKLNSLDNFSLKNHQTDVLLEDKIQLKKYINNFIFIPQKTG